jgi:predicted nuclease of predicted toxin-antitoxin system
MGYRVLCDENIERATVNYLRQLGHDVERVPEVSTLDEGDPDERLAEYSNATDRLILTQDQVF